VTGYVLVTQLGEPIRPYTYSDRFATLCRMAGVPIVRLHSVRHTLAHDHAQKACVPADAAALLGHTVAVHLSAYVGQTRRVLGLPPAVSELRLQRPSEIPVKLCRSTVCRARRHML
jgi:integrase